MFLVTTRQVCADAAASRWPQRLGVSVKIDIIASMEGW